MSQAKTGDTVTVHYTGTLEDGTQFANSIDHEPAEFKLGSGQAIPGLYKAVEGMTVGEKTVNIPPQEGYGLHRENMVQDVPRSALPQDLSPVVGTQLQAKTRRRVRFSISSSRPSTQKPLQLTATIRWPARTFALISNWLRYVVSQTGSRGVQTLMNLRILRAFSDVVETAR